MWHVKPPLEPPADKWVAPLMPPVRPNIYPVQWSHLDDFPRIYTTVDSDITPAFFPQAFACNNHDQGMQLIIHKGELQEVPSRKGKMRENQIRIHKCPGQQYSPSQSLVIYPGQNQSLSPMLSVSFVRGVASMLCAFCLLVSQWESAYLKWPENIKMFWECMCFCYCSIPTYTARRELKSNTGRILLMNKMLQTFCWEEWCLVWY